MTAPGQEPDEVLTPVAPGVSYEPLRMVPREPGATTHEEGRQPDARAPAGGPDLVAVPIEEGVETARHYLDLPVRLAGLHHSDLDRYEVKRRGVPVKYVVPASGTPILVDAIAIPAGARLS